MFVFYSAIRFVLKLFCIWAIIKPYYYNFPSILTIFFVCVCNCLASAKINLNSETEFPYISNIVWYDFAIPPLINYRADRSSN